MKKTLNYYIFKNFPQLNLFSICPTELFIHIIEWTEWMKNRIGTDMGAKRIESVMFNGPWPRPELGGEG